MAVVTVRWRRWHSQRNEPLGRSANDSTIRGLRLNVKAVFGNQTLTEFETAASIELQQFGGRSTGRSQSNDQSRL